MREFEEHRRTMAGRDPATLRRRITTLERRGVPVQREKAVDDKGIDPISYTRYFLTPEFKKSLLAEAREWAVDRATLPSASIMDRAGPGEG